MFHKRTKHVKINYHVLRDRVLVGLIRTQIGTYGQLSDIFTQGLSMTSFDLVSGRLSLFGL